MVLQRCSGCSRKPKASQHTGASVYRPRCSDRRVLRLRRATVNRESLCLQGVAHRAHHSGHGMKQASMKFRMVNGKRTAYDQHAAIFRSGLDPLIELNTHVLRSCPVSQRLWFDLKRLGSRTARAWVPDRGINARTLAFFQVLRHETTTIQPCLFL